MVEIKCPPEAIIQGLVLCTIKKTKAGIPNIDTRTYVPYKEFQEKDAMKKLVPGWYTIQPKLMYLSGEKIGKSVFWKYTNWLCIDRINGKTLFRLDPFNSTSEHAQ